MPYWTVAQCEPRRERVAQYFLEQAGFESYLPLIKSAAAKIVPLFPSYLFIVVENAWWSIDNTIGVVHLLKNGERPAKLSDRTVDQIRSQEKNGIIKLPEKPKLKIGDKVRILRGSFADRFALYDGMSGKERAFVLLEMLGRQVRTEVRRIDFIEIREQKALASP
jgi:transcriptional antiterminator RfaH